MAWMGSHRGRQQQTAATDMGEIWFLLRLAAAAVGSKRGCCATAVMTATVMFAATAGVLYACVLPGWGTRLRVGRGGCRCLVVGSCNRNHLCRARGARVHS